MALAIDGEASSDHVSLDRLVRQIDPDLPDSGPIQVIHVDLYCRRSGHLEQEIESAFGL